MLSEPTHDDGTATRERVVRWHDPAALAAAGAGLTGLAFLDAIRTGQLPPPPIASLLGLTLVELDVGRVVFTVEPDESTYNPIGVVHGGLVCTLADTVAGCAVHSTLDADQAYTSIDITVNYLRAVTAASGTLRATGTIAKAGRRVAFAQAEIIDGRGALVATATSNCLVMARP